VRRLGECDRVKEVRVLQTPPFPVESAEEVPLGLSLRRVDGEGRLFGPPLPELPFGTLIELTLPRESIGRSSSVSSSVLYLDPELTEQDRVMTQNHSF
jgi:hypothetical protein